MRSRGWSRSRPKCCRCQGVRRGVGATYSTVDGLGLEGFHLWRNLFGHAERLRLEVYRKLAASTSERDIRLAVEEMEDRFGPLPKEVERLLSVARLRHLARKAGVGDIGVQGTRIKVHPVELADSKQVRLKRLFPGAVYRAAAKAIQLPFPKAGRNVTDPKLRDVDLVQWAADFLSTMFDLEKIDVRGGKKLKKKVVSAREA